jgi:uncharacterized protein HemX
MRSSVAVAFLCGLILGLVTGIGGAGFVLLPAQFNLQQERLKAEEVQREMTEQRIMDERELLDARNRQRQAEAKQKRLELEKKQLEQRLEDANRQLGEAQQKLQKRP